MTPTTPPALDWPTILDQAASFITTEYASLTRAGAPVTWPVTPYRGRDDRTIDVTTGLTYPLKAERARRNPKVALSFSFPTGSGLHEPATFVVLGLASVRDADLRANSARYLHAASQRFPKSFEKVPRFLLRRMGWYWTRIWIEVTPVRVLWWPAGALDVPPLEWRAPGEPVAPPSDPPPQGTTSGSWNTTRVVWRERAAGAVERLGLPVVTTVTGDGWPLPLRARAATPTADGYDVALPTGVQLEAGPAFVSFHSHGEVFTGQENIGLDARCEPGEGGAHLTVTRALADWGLPSSPLGNALTMMRAGRHLRPRLQAEAARRGQPVPSFDALGFRGE